MFNLLIHFDMTTVNLSAAALKKNNFKSKEVCNK